MNNHSVIVDDKSGSDDHTLALNTNQGIQLQIAQDGNDAFIDLEGEEAGRLMRKIHEELGEFSPFFKVMKKAKSYDELDIKISRFYPDEDVQHNESEGGLVEIGEIAASHFGYL